MNDRQITRYTPGTTGYICTLECGHTRHLSTIPPNSRALCWDCDPPEPCCYPEDGFEAMCEECRRDMLSAQIDNTYDRLRDETLLTKEE